MQAFTVTYPAQLISTADAKVHARVDYAADDALIGTCCRMAQDYIQAHTGQRVGGQTVNLLFDSFDGTEVILDLGPITSVLSIKYLDKDGTEQTFDPVNYRFMRGFRSIIALRPYKSWPETYAMKQAVTIQVKCGWVISADTTAGETQLPNDLLKLAFLLVNHFYEYRELVHTGLQLREFPVHLDAPGICASHARTNL